METSLHHLMQVAILSVYTGAQSPRVECRVRREAGGKCIPGLGRRVGMNGVDKFLFFSQEIQSRLICVRNMFRAVFPWAFSLIPNSSQGLAIGLGLVHIQKRFPNLFTYVECYEVHVFLCILLNKNNFLKAKPNSFIVLCTLVLSLNSKFLRFLISKLNLYPAFLNNQKSVKLSWL